jgi:hypothetical protein
LLNKDSGAIHLFCSSHKNLLQRQLTLSLANGDRRDRESQTYKYEAIRNQAKEEAAQHNLSTQITSPVSFTPLNSSI